jgi:hypothetical protein
MSVAIEQVTLSGPFDKSSYPQGVAVPSLNRQEWFVNRPITDSPEDAFLAEVGLTERCIGMIQRFNDQPRRFIICNAWPAVEHRSLKAAVRWLVENESKWTPCS